MKLYRAVISIFIVFLMFIMPNTTVRADEECKGIILIDAGHGKITPGDVKKVLESKNRAISSDTAPAKGLFLFKVIY